MITKRKVVYGVLLTIAWLPAVVLGKTCAPLGEAFQSDRQALTAIVDMSSEVCVLAEGFAWTEGPLWIDELNGLVFSDIPASKVYLYEANGKLSEYLADSKYSNGLVLDHDRRLVLLQSRNRSVGRMKTPVSAPGSAFDILATHYHGKRFNSPNDGVYNQAGDFFFTDPPYGLPNGINDKNKELPFQGVFVLTHEGELILLDSTLSYPNGIALSDDGSVLFVAVSDDRDSAWYRYDVNTDLSLSGKQRVYKADSADKIHGLPDGMAFHKDGLLFATGPGGLYIFDNEGALQGRIIINNIVSNVAFDSAFSTLYITANNTLMSITLK